MWACPSASRTSLGRAPSGTRCTARDVAIPRDDRARYALPTMTRSRILLFGAVLVAALGCDQATKQLAEATLGTPEVVSLAGDAVRFELASNPGAFLSLGEQLPAGARNVLFLLLAPLALTLVCVGLLRAGRPGTSALVGLALIVGGGLGNWLDRVLQEGAVTDFVSLGLGSLRTGIFNVADVAIFAGIALVALDRELGLWPRRRGEAAEDALEGGPVRD